jgi:hypothetical protein
LYNDESLHENFPYALKTKNNYEIEWITASSDKRF